MSDNIVTTSVADNALPIRSSLLDRSVLTLVRVNWEVLAWATLLVIGAVSRFYELGVRAMSHDESLHALYSYYLYNAGNYEHNPMMHGPLLFHVNALFYFLFGDNDTTARLAPALTGIVLIGAVWYFRRYLGRVGALATAVMVTISPSLLFHSRYIRNDIYIALFTVIWAYAAFRYLDNEDRRPGRWLVVMVLGMALGFISKENHFITGAIIGSYFVGLALWQVIGRRFFSAIIPFFFLGGIGFWLMETGRTLPAVLVGGTGLLLTFLIAGYWLFFNGTNRWSQLRENRAADVAVLMLTLVLPFTAPFGHLALGWDAMAYGTTQELLRSALLVGIIVALSIGIAIYWFGRRNRESDDEYGGFLDFATWGQLMGLFWIIQVLFFTTFLTNTRNGLATGVVGSLGYWLAQQEVERGSQPDYYYVMLASLYEFLPMLLSAGGILSIIYWLRKNGGWDPVARDDLPAELQMFDVTDGEEVPVSNMAVEKQDKTPESSVGALDGLAGRLRQNRVYFAIFMVWWTLGSWGGYTLAGEKMPWLLTHIALPMCFLGGWWFGWVVNRIDWRKAKETRAIWLLGVAPAMVFVVAILIAGMPSMGRSVDALAATMQWLLALGIGAGLIYLALRWMRAVNWRNGLRLLGIGFTALLFLLTIRFTFMLNYINYDLVTEYLVYAHGSPDIKQALKEIDLISQRTVGDRNIMIAYDDKSSWPLSWYMREYPNSRFYGDNPTADVMAAPVVIVGTDNYEKVRPYMARDYVKRTYRLVWWPDQGYFNLTWDRFWDTVTDREKLEKIWQIVFYRRYQDDEDPTRWRDLTEWPNQHPFEMYVRRDIAAEIWDLNVAPVDDPSREMAALLREREVDVPAATVLEGTYSDTPLFLPREVAVGGDGTKVIADSGNHRIVVVNPDGSFAFEIGSLCRLGEGAAGGCVDPDGAGPVELGDGQFNEPWGVAVDGEGTIYVADTWNGRIQVFDDEGNFLRKWGYFNTTNGELGDGFAMFGPRGIAIDSIGNLLVADTGNKRILQYSPEGELLQQIGGGGVVLGRFNEPVSVAVDANDGSIYVADAWNRRIQKLDSSLTAIAEWPVPGWESQEIYHKPYIAVADNGDVYITDPQYYRVIAYNSAGGLKSTFGDYGTELNRMALPNGIAYDSLNNLIFVVDADNNRVIGFPALP